MGRGHDKSSRRWESVLDAPAGQYHTVFRLGISSLRFLLEEREAGYWMSTSIGNISTGAFGESFFKLSVLEESLWRSLGRDGLKKKGVEAGRRRVGMGGFGAEDGVEAPEACLQKAGIN